MQNKYISLLVLIFNSQKRVVYEWLQVHKGGRVARGAYPGTPALRQPAAHRSVCKPNVIGIQVNKEAYCM